MLVPDGKRVDDPQPPAPLARERRPMQVESPAVAKRGEWQELLLRAAAEGGHRADLDEGRFSRDPKWPPPDNPPGRVARERLGRLCEVEAELLADRDEAIEESQGQLHVV